MIWMEMQEWNFYWLFFLKIFYAIRLRCSTRSWKIKILKTYIQQLYYYIITTTIADCRWFFFCFVNFSDVSLIFLNERQNDIDTNDLFFWLTKSMYRLTTLLFKLFSQFGIRSSQNYSILVKNKFMFVYFWISFSK